VVDARAGESSVIELDGLPQDMIYDPARKVLLLSLQDRGLIASIGSDNRISGTFRLVASEPTGLALDNAHRRLYVAVRYAVLGLNADTGQELSRVPAPGGTDTLILDPDGGLLYAAAGDGSVLAIDTNRNTVDHELPTNVRGYSIAYDPAHKMLFMPGGREGRSKMVILRPVSALGPPPPVTAETPAPSEQTAMRK
jgi:DNA-binding beta-propeller fold protein YncE